MVVTCFLALRGSKLWFGMKLEAPDGLAMPSPQLHSTLYISKFTCDEVRRIGIRLVMILASDHLFPLHTLSVPPSYRHCGACMPVYPYAERPQQSVVSDRGTPATSVHFHDFSQEVTIIACVRAGGRSPTRLCHTLVARLHSRCICTWSLQNLAR